MSANNKTPPVVNFPLLLTHFNNLKDSWATQRIVLSPHSSLQEQDTKTKCKIEERCLCAKADMDDISFICKTKKKLSASDLKSP